MRKRTVTTIEMHQIVTIRRPVGAALAWCPACLKEVLMLTPDEAIALAQSTVRDIYARVEAGELHCMDTDDGSLRVCVNSLAGTASL